MIIHYVYDYKENSRMEGKDGLAFRQMKQDRQKQIYRELDEDIREALQASSATEYLGENK
jgi:hypothetical protein